MATASASSGRRGGLHLMRISVENYFTRDVVVHADAPGLHYELTVGPVRQRYMVIPRRTMRSPPSPTAAPPAT